MSALTASMEHAAHFVVDILDPDTRCIVDDLRFSVDDVRDLTAVLTIDDFGPAVGYDLDHTDLDRIAHRFGVRFPERARTAIIRRRHWLDDLPYRTHTDRELLMMLAGTKPLAVFWEPYPSELCVSSFPETRFDEHVSEGRFVKREYIEPLPSEDGSAIRVVLYAVPTEVWRFNAYLLLRRTARKVDWNEGFERMEGSLLGYEDWQNDAFIEAAREQQKLSVASR